MELKGNKKYTSNETLMSIKEVAEILHVTPEAIKKHIRAYYPGYMTNGRKSFLTQEIVTGIRKFMAPTTRVAGIHTELEIQNMIKIVLEWYNLKIQEIETKMAQPAPFDLIRSKFDEYKGNFSLSATAKILDIGKGRNEFIALLRDKKILMKQGQFNEPYQCFINQKYFVVHCFNNEDSHRLIPVTYVTPKGLEWLSKMFSKKTKLSMISTDTLQILEEKTESMKY